MKKRVTREDGPESWGPQRTSIVRMLMPAASAAATTFSALGTVTVMVSKKTGAAAAFVVP